MLFAFVSPKTSDRYIGATKEPATPPLEKGLSLAKYLASVHIFDCFVTPVGCTDGAVGLRLSVSELGI